MATYFCITFEYSKNRLTNHTVSEFYYNLINNGFSFKGGYCGSEKNTLEEIINWNQQKLNDDFQLEYTEHYTHDYKQVLFNLYGFSVARLFILNLKKNDYFSFELIIPEDDFLQIKRGRKRKVIRLYDRMEYIKELIEKMWNTDTFNYINTTWESTSGYSPVNDLKNNKEPIIQPYAIIPTELLRGTLKCQSQIIGNNGIMLIDDENWYYFE